MEKCKREMKKCILCEWLIRLSNKWIIALLTSYAWLYMVRADLFY